MKKIKFFLPFAAIALLASCSDDKVVDTPNDNTGDGIYLNLQIASNLSTRTATGKEGNEEGLVNETKDENTISNAYVIFTLSNDPTTVVAASDLDNAAGTNNVFTVNNKLSSEASEALRSAVASGSATFNVFVVANPTTTTKPDATSTINESGIATADAFKTKSTFLMSGVAQNINITKADVERATSAANAVQLGTVEVQRAMARFDISTVDSHLKFDVPVKDSKDETIAGLTVEFTDVQLVNESKNLYLFKQVAKDENNAPGSYTLFEKESQTYLWVGDPYLTQKLASNEDYFSNQLKGAKGVDFSQYTNWANIASDIKQSDNQANKPEPEPSGDQDSPVNDWTDYYAWTYVTPNTLPTGDYSTQQLKNNSTGVIFKAVMKAADSANTEEGLGKAVNDEEDLYLYGSTLIGSLEDLKNYVSKAEDTDIIKVRYNLAKEAAEDESAEKLDPQLKTNGFTIYRYDSSVEGYPMYYVYWNQHNSNYLNNNMGKMEYGVVRNNIYKLAVNSIAKLGHPESPDDDPDPVIPDTPVETQDIYAEITVKVIDWYVRVNNIDF